MFDIKEKINNTFDEFFFTRMSMKKEDLLPTATINEIASKIDGDKSNYKEKNIFITRYIISLLDIFISLLKEKIKGPMMYDIQKTGLKKNIENISNDYKTDDNISQSIMKYAMTGTEFEKLLTVEIFTEWCSKLREKTNIKLTDIFNFLKNQQQNQQLINQFVSSLLAPLVYDDTSEEKERIKTFFANKYKITGLQHDLFESNEWVKTIEAKFNKIGYIHEVDSFKRYKEMLMGVFVSDGKVFVSNIDNINLFLPDSNKITKSDDNIKYLKIEGGSSSYIEQFGGIIGGSILLKPFCMPLILLFLIFIVFYMANEIHQERKMCSQNRAISNRKYIY